MPVYWFGDTHKVKACCLNGTVSRFDSSPLISSLDVITCVCICYAQVFYPIQMFQHVICSCLMCHVFVW